MPDYAPFRVPDETEYHIALLAHREVGLYAVAGVTGVHAAEIYDVVHVLYHLDGFIREASSAQTYYIDTAESDRDTACKHIRRDVLIDPRTAADHRMRTDFRKLVYYGASADYRPVVDIGLACKAYEAHKDTVVTYPAVVCHMDIGHDEHIVSYLRHTFAAGIGPPVDCGALPYCNIVAYLHISHFAVEFEILRSGTDHGAWIYSAVLTHLHILKDICVREQFASVANLDIAFDIAERSYFDIVANLGIRMNNSCRMYFLRHFVQCFISKKLFQYQSSHLFCCTRVDLVSGLHGRHTRFQPLAHECEIAHKVQ